MKIPKSSPIFRKRKFKNSKVKKIVVPIPALQITKNYAKRVFVGNIAPSYTFSFQYMYLASDPFEWHEFKKWQKMGDISPTILLNRFYNIFDHLRRVSSQKESDVLTNMFKHCHEIPEKDIRELGLDLIHKALPSGKLFQIGFDDTKERIIGVFDKKNLSTFNVFMIDMWHETY